jgi:sugar/nucleoside kinase (ribokinase family)
VIHIPGFDVRCIDSNGAGDTHDGVFIAALMAGATPADAVLIANAAAALSTTRIGPATSPDFTETRQFLEASGRMPSASEIWERVQSGAQDAQQEE